LRGRLLTRNAPRDSEVVGHLVVAESDLMLSSHVFSWAETL
jgi:hypothetical protein